MKYLVIAIVLFGLAGTASATYYGTHSYRGSTIRRSYHPSHYRQSRFYGNQFRYSKRQLLFLKAERLGLASRFEARFRNGLSFNDEIELIRRLRLYSSGFLR